MSGSRYVRNVTQVRFACLRSTPVFKSKVNVVARSEVADGFLGMIGYGGRHAVAGTFNVAL